MLSFVAVAIILLLICYKVWCKTLFPPTPAAKQHLIQFPADLFMVRSSPYLHTTSSPGFISYPYLLPICFKLPVEQWMSNGCMTSEFHPEITVLPKARFLLLRVTFPIAYFVGRCHRTARGSDRRDCYFSRHPIFYYQLRSQLSGTSR